MRQRLAALIGAVVLVGAAGHAAPRQQPEEAIVAWFKAYDAAFVAKDLTALGAMYHPDVTVFEGGGIDRGWAAYRDRHLGPELKSFEDLQFVHTNVVVRFVGPDAAYVTAEYTLKARIGERVVDSGGLATHVMVREQGAWKIRHTHTSARRRAPGGML